MRQPETVGGRYELGDLLGRGGMAEVRLGRDRRLGRTVAVKTLRHDMARDLSFRERFRREARAAASLNHPSVVAVYDSGEHQAADGQCIPYIVMEHVQGTTLAELLRCGDSLTPRRALQLADGVLAALEHAHAKGIVHRDIKPANVMLTADGTVKVMDFGIARVLATRQCALTGTGIVIGTAAYLSPEQAMGQPVDTRSDLYSAGCLLYELLTGRPPFTGSSPIAVAHRQVHEEPPPPSAFRPGMPPQVDDLVLRVLAKDPGLRQQDAANLRADIARALTGNTPATQPQAPPQQSHSRSGTVSRPLPATPTMPSTTRVHGPATSTDPRPTKVERPRRSVRARPALLGLALLVAVAIGGAAVATQSAVRHPATAASASIPAPDLLGQTMPQARAHAQAAGFRVILGAYGSCATPNLRFRRICGQSPLPRTPLKPGAVIHVRVSLQPRRNSTSTP
ncbi:protein kinase domain-containing protein [Streptomyces cynarae]|uniref:protein kinase domain-containing protein n=1 Tax=Streptomyces cynarae TaxID=2981134 RepID=UPI00406C5FE1